ncbi:MAG: amidase [Thaumarchaeota archaeon]|nr:amidase [Nitrososphaerota archaeon]
MTTLRTAKEISDAYESGSASPVGLTTAYLQRAEKVNEGLNCFITILGDSALAAAKASELRAREKRRLGPLDGVPIVIKDLIYIEGVKCTAGSKILAKNVAPYDSTVAQKLKAAGAVILGTTNLHEFASGVTGENPHFGAVRNPWDTERMAGGSSSGSAAAVAAGLAPLGLGTDTAGSVRIPAALCGVLGLKPTYGRISRLGVIPLAPSFDTVGTLASSAWDTAALLQVLAGHGQEDLTTVSAEVPDYLKDLDAPLGHPRVGVPRRFFHDQIDPAVEEKFNGFLERLSELGCEVKESNLDGAEEAYKLWLPIRKAEATAFHLSWLEAHPGLYGEDTRRLLEEGKNVSGVDYVSAQNARPTLMERFISSMKEVDLVAVPTTCVPAPLLGHSSVMAGAKEMDVRTALLRLTLPFNTVGFPAISVAAGLSDGLPVGVQLAAKPFDESVLLRVVNAFEGRFGPFPAPPSSWQP